jgi:lipocalin
MPIITSRTRTRTMDQETFSQLTGIVKSQGYDLSDLSLTPQP